MDETLDRMTESVCRSLRALWAGALALWRARPQSWRILKLMAIDILGWLITLYTAAGLWLSAIFTVRWDPLGRSRALIWLQGRGGPRAVQVDGAATERERRVVAWFYRWHDTPDDDDWRRCLARFALAAPPRHTLLVFRADERVEVAITRLGKGSTRGERTVVHSRGAASGPARPIAGLIPLGGLTVERLLKDAISS